MFFVHTKIHQNIDKWYYKMYFIIYQYQIYRTNLSSMYSVDDAATRCYTRVQYFSYCDSSDGNLEQS